VENANSGLVRPGGGPLSNHGGGSDTSEHRGAPINTVTGMGEKETKAMETLWRFKGGRGR